MSGWSETDDTDDWDDDDALIDCPYCGEPIFDDAERCPYCECYISEQDRPPTTRPWWFVLGFLLCIAIIYLWILL